MFKFSFTQGTEISQIPIKCPNDCVHHATQEKLKSTANLIDEYVQISEQSGVFIHMSTVFTLEE